MKALLDDIRSGWLPVDQIPGYLWYLLFEFASMDFVLNLTGMIIVLISLLIAFAFMAFR